MKKTDDGLNSNMMPEIDDSTFSPTGDDALLIEGDTNPSNKSTEIQTDEAPVASQVAEPVAPEPVNPEMEEPESEEVEEKQSNKSKKTQVKPKNKTAKKGTALPLFVVLLLAGCGGVWYYFSRPTEQPVVEQPKVVEPVVVVEEPKVQNVEPEPMVIDTVPPAAPVPPPARIATKYKVPKGWLVGYRAVPDEAEAIKIVAELSYIDSLPCGYYWINDVRQAEKLFKIYVGPYITKEDAQAVLPSVQAKRADAYIYTEDK